MARAYKCDRCGSYYDFYGDSKDDASDFAGKTIYINSIGANYKSRTDQHCDIKFVDVCPSCKESFLQWWNRWQEENYNSHNEERE